ncbi:DUF72 domain-containing protein [Dokdonella sp.]|uniref:DUF72 domain-containing protein n=1 Tax=Dokdonella sp. TaxID=2291710 RepID=UPI001B11BB4A|nr:DUF72 domain-containing protein [Dokdonella sp.]MBO9663983.1 DUF72 domain-containing protein [Dokdonella sp.]
MPTRKTEDTDLFVARPSAATGIRVGIGGWTYAPWRDNFYPAKLVQRRELEYASRALSAIEVNGTYYGAQKPATYAKWRAETPDGFVFSLKAPRYATDRRTLADAGRTVADFVHGGLAELGDRLGPINWQFLPNKAFDRDDFETFLALLPRELDGRALRHVAEVRHESFRSDEYLQLARRYRVATVFTDSPKHPSFADVTGDFVYARLMCSDANLASGYPPAALDRWAARANAWAAGDEPDDLPRVLPAAPTSARREVFVFFINGAKERAPHAAMGLLERLRSTA